MGSKRRAEVTTIREKRTEIPQRERERERERERNEITKSKRKESKRRGRLGKAKNYK